MRNTKLLLPLLLVLIAVLPCHAQFVSVSAGGLFSQSKGSSAPASNNFDTSWIVAADGGIPVFPFVVAAVHYSYARPGDSLAVGSLSPASVTVAQQNLAVEGRLRTPSLMGWRLYGLAGGGFSHFSPSGSNLPSSIGSETKPMFTLGGGLERGIFPLVRLKVEIRDYVTSDLSGLLISGAWHRVAVLGGITLGR